MNNLLTIPLQDCIYEVLRKGIKNPDIVYDFGPVIPKVYEVIKKNSDRTDYGLTNNASEAAKWRNLRSIWDEEFPKIDPSVFGPKNGRIFGGERSALLQRMRGGVSASKAKQS